MEVVTRRSINSLTVIELTDDIAFLMLREYSDEWSCASARSQRDNTKLYLECFWRWK